MDKQNVSHGLESESNIIYEDVDIKNEHCDQKIISDAQATDQDNLYDDIQFPINNMPESEHFSPSQIFLNPSYATVQITK